MRRSESALKAFYVDDPLKALRSAEAIIHLALGLMSMMRQISATKVHQQLQRVSQSAQSKVLEDAAVKIDDETIKRALGLLWDTVTDEFIFSTAFRAEERDLENGKLNLRSNGISWPVHHRGKDSFSRALETQPAGIRI